MWKKGLGEGVWEKVIYESNLSRFVVWKEESMKGGLRCVGKGIGSV